MSHARWYAVQVRTGREEDARLLVAQASEEAVGNGSEPLFQECFVPRWTTGYRQHGRYITEERTLLPGYLMIITKDAVRLDIALSRVRAFTKLLGGGDKGFTPLAEEEVEWLDRFTQLGHRVVGMSTAQALPGAKVCVIDGPLVGCEAMIEKVDHRKKTAWVGLSVCGRKVVVPLGLRVLRRQEKDPRI